MAWNIKYYGEWVDFDGNSNRLEILTENTVTAKEVKVNSFVVDYPSIDLFGQETMYGCGAKIRIMSETKLFYLDELYTIEPQGLQVRHYLNSELNYIGFLDTEQYTDDFSGRINYDIELTSNNGMAVLNRINMSDNSGVPLTKIHKAIDVIKMALNKLKIDFDLIYIGLSTTLEEGLATEETLLHKLFIKGDNYIDEKGNLMSCREVVNAILFPLGARMYFHNNSVYIIDINEIAQNGDLNLKTFTFDSLVYGSSILISNKFDIDERLGNYSLSMQPGVNKIDLKFNKYVYDTPTELSNNNLSGFVEEVTRIKDDGDTQEEYVEKIYQNGWCNVLEPLHTKFVKRRKKNEVDEGETFIRLIGQDTFSPNIEIKTNQNFVSSRQFLRINGQIMVEDLDNFLIEEEIEPASWLDEAKYVFQTQFYTDNGDYRDVYFLNDSWRAMDDDSKDYESDTYFNYFAIYAGAANNNSEKFPVNRWIDLNKVIGEDEDKYSFIIPLNSDDAKSDTNKAYSLRGGNLKIKIQVPEYAFPDVRPDKIYTLAIKNLSFTLVTLDEYGNFIEVDNNDEEYKGKIDENYMNSLELNAKHGTDIDGNSRGMFLVETVASTFDSDYADNKRLINANNFVREGYTGTSEELLLRTYLSNLQQSRYILKCTIRNYYPFFHTFLFDALTRDNIPVRMLPTSMSVDYMSATTDLTINEIVKDE